MAERREHRRIKKRLQVNYGQADLDSRGVATDISISGMFLDCRHPPPVGTRLHLQVLDPARPFYVEAQVMRVLIADPRLRTLDKGGAGLRFLMPAELIAAALPNKAERVQETNALICGDAVAVKNLLSQQIYSSIVVVPVADPAPRAGDVVEFTIYVEIGTGTEIGGRGRVVQLIGPQDGDRQAVLQIEDSAGVTTALEAAIS